MGLGEFGSLLLQVQGCFGRKLLGKHPKDAIPISSHSSLANSACELTIACPRHFDTFAFDFHRWGNIPAYPCIVMGSPPTPPYTTAPRFLLDWPQFGVFFLHNLCQGENLRRCSKGGGEY